MVTYETKKLILDFILIGLCYALFFTTLTFFVYPIELANYRTISELVTRFLGSAIFFGAVCGIFCGFIGSIWVNRLDFKSPISIGIFTGIMVVIIGSIIFPILGTLVRIYYFSINPAEAYLEVSLLLNYSLLGVFPGLLTSVLAGIVGGIATSSIGQVSTT